MLNGAQPRLSDGGKQQAGRRCFFVFTTISCLTSRVNSNKPPKPASSSTWWGEWGDIWTTLNGPRRNSIDHRPWCFHQVLNGESVWIIERERERERKREREHVWCYCREQVLRCVFKGMFETAFGRVWDRERGKQRVRVGWVLERDSERLNCSSCYLLRHAQNVLKRYRLFMSSVCV